MSTVTVISAETMREMQAAADRAAKGIRDPQAMCETCDEMDRMREELHQRIGTVDLAVDLVRDARSR